MDQKLKNLTGIKVTVALVCHREKEKLAGPLEDLKRQTAFSNIGEVLVFQNGNCQQTKKTATSFLRELPLKIFSSSKNHLGLARAELVRRAKYELIAWTDSDCRLPANWLEALISHWENSSNQNVAAIGGPNRLPENKWWKRVVNLSLSHPFGHGWSPQAWKVKKRTKVSHIPTTNGLFLKSAILKAGNFSEKHKTAGEDMDLGIRLSRQGDLLLFPQPVVINDYAGSYFESLKRLFVFGQARSERKDFLSRSSSLFFPSMAGFLILGFFYKYFWLFPLSWLACLFLAGLFVSFKSRAPAGLILPFFWLAQQLFYSAGSFFRLSRIFQKTGEGQRL